MVRPAPPILTLLLLALVGGCDGIWIAVPGRSDAGPRPTDLGPPTDAPTGPRPTVVGSLPADGEDMARTDTAILLRFSESMDPAFGTIRVEPGDIALRATDAEWLRDSALYDTPRPDRPDTGAVFRLPRELTGGIEHTVTLACDFRSARGVRFDCADLPVISFTTLDEQPPEVVASVPAEGASSVSVRGLREVALTFSEAMDTTSGVVDVLAPGTAPPRVGSLRWEGRTVRARLLDPLVYDTAYQLRPRAFRDRAGNDVRGRPYLGNGVVDFSTGPDVDPPRIEYSIPTEGQRGVSASLSAIRVALSEPVEAPDGVTQLARLSDGTSAWDLPGHLTTDRRTMVYQIRDALEERVAYALDLSTARLRDMAGNRLDTLHYLGNGMLDFQVDVDTYGPRVTDSAPIEGSVGVELTTPTVRLSFSEPMDISMTSAVLTDGQSTALVEGVWGAGDTELVLDVEGHLQAGRVVRVILDEHRDVRGNPLDDVQPYLGDSALDFATESPTGDDCFQPLLADQAEVTLSGGLRWTIPADDYTDSGSTDSCDGDAAGAAADVVLEIHKRTGTLAEGGRLLRVAVSSASTSDLNFELRAGSCDPSRSAGRIACQSGLESGGGTYDLRAGVYYLWIAKETGGAFPGATVTVDEVPWWPEGEGCGAPFTVLSPTVYVPPTTVGGPHTFEVLPSLVQTFDRGAVSHGPGEMPCAAEHGADAVIEFSKRPGSVLQVRAVPVDIRTNAAALNLEVSLGCDPLGSRFTSVACEPGIVRPREVTVAGPGGPVYVWLSADERDKPFPGATVRITEVAAAPGESCSTARALAPGVTHVSLDSTESLGGGDCVEAGRDLTWYGFSPGQDLAVVGTDVPSALVLADQDTNLPLVCRPEGTPTPATALVRAGRTLCIGIPSDSGVTRLVVDDRPYPGVRGAVEDLRVLRPLGDLGEALPWNDDVWMAASPTTLYLAGESDPSVGLGPRVTFAPLGGGARSVLAESRFPLPLGQAGVAVGEQLFAVDDVEAPSVPRVHRLTDGRTYPWRPQAWDGGSPSYGGPSFSLAYDGATLSLASHDTSEARFWTVDPRSPGSPTFVGVTTRLRRVAGLAADRTYFYVVGAQDRGGSSGERVGVWRLLRHAVDRTEPELIMELPLDLTHGIPVVLDDPERPRTLYVRQVDAGSPNRVLAIVDPAGPSPTSVGPVVRLGTPRDRGMAYDRAREALVLFETETTREGRIVRVR